MKHNWEYKKLGDVCDILDNRRKPVSQVDRVAGEYPYYGASGIQDYVDNYIFDGTFLLVGEDGAKWEAKEKSAYSVSGKCWVNNHAHVLDFSNSIVLQKLVEYFLCYSDLSKYIKGAVVPKLNKNNLVSIQIPVPTMDVQEQIVAELYKINEIISDCKEAIRNLDNLAQSLFYDYFGTIDETVELLHYVDSLVGGKSLAGNEINENKVLKSGAVTYDYFDKSSFKYLPNDYVPSESHLVSLGDLIISRMNTPELVGACGYVFDVDENVFLPDRLWRIEYKSNANPIFLWKSLISEEAKIQIRRKASGTSGSMKNISKPNLLSIKLKKVPLELQEKFAARIQQIEQQKKGLEETIAEMQTLLDSRMDYWFN